MDSVKNRSVDVRELLYSWYEEPKLEETVVHDHGKTGKTGKTLQDASPTNTTNTTNTTTTHYTHNTNNEETKLLKKKIKNLLSVAGALYDEKRA
jgi:hypothetical protein